jgi:glycerate 2-kinase
MHANVVIAPDSFKGSLSAREAAAAIADGWRSIRPDDTLTLLPQADGGEGTLDAIEASVADTVRHSVERVTGPDGRQTRAGWLELPGRTAVVELAMSSGLPLMATADALGASTRGLGELIGHALDAGMRSLIIALGGSASTDGGSGALAALGMQLLDATGTPLPDGGAALATLHTVALHGLRSPPPGGVTLLTDVTAPLLGLHGSAAVFGPQKGATPDDVRDLEHALSAYAELLGGNPTEPGAGSAGGTAYGFAAAWGAQIVSGADYVARLTGLESAIENASAILTGEGRFDDQSVAGKVVGNILSLSRDSGARAGVIAGQIGAPTGVWELGLDVLAGSITAAIGEPERWLREAGSRAAKALI